jgi:hypothetical protein
MKEKATQILGWNGTMISGSKSGYRNRNPNNLAIFNANIIAMTAVPEKIWHGDLDLTLSIDKIKELSCDLNVEIRVLREMDARFEYEDSPQVQRFVLSVKPDGAYSLGEVEKDYYSLETLTSSTND